MLSADHLARLTRKYAINETTVLREYYQILFLSRLYGTTHGRCVFFKGETAIHLIFLAPRFSEDLDFTVTMPEPEFVSFLSSVFRSITKEEEVTVKEKKTTAGKRFLLTAAPSIVPYAIFINLDFSFREPVQQPAQFMMTPEYPVLFSAYIHHLSKEELFAEKIRALVTRRKGRDLYDLWYLLTQGATYSPELVKKKLQYYKLEQTSKKDIAGRIMTFPEKDFVLDLRPFLPIKDRNQLPATFSYMKEYIGKHL